MAKKETLTPDEIAVITQIGVPLFKELIDIFNQYKGKGVDLSALLNKASTFNDVDFDSIPVL